MQDGELVNVFLTAVPHDGSSFFKGFPVLNQARVTCVFPSFTLSKTSRGFAVVCHSCILHLIRPELDAQRLRMQAQHPTLYTVPTSGPKLGSALGKPSFMFNVVVAVAIAATGEHLKVGRFG